jgi:RNA polymerase sigma-70 factor (ECF subfamily)
LSLPPGAAPSHDTAERIARASYGRLLAYLAGRWRDLAAAEDALAEAFATALERWPAEGVPERPEGWLLTVARRKLTDAARGERIRRRPELVARLAGEEPGAPDDADTLPDERLRLMLVCAHPAIDAAVRPALILQTVLGLEVKAMAGAFLLSTETLTKRLVRAKAKIKAAGLRFEEPAPADLGPRLHALLEAIYAAYFLGREGALDAGDAHDRLRGEAVYLAGVVAAALPENAEAQGFLALLLFCEARRPAQLDEAGEFVPLLEQDPRKWDRALLRAGQARLIAAAAHETRGPFQLEAAIQAAHCYRARSGEVPWREIATLYQTLVRDYPTTGARVGMAVAVAHAEGDAGAGLALLDRIDPALVRSYQPFWAARWHLHETAGQRAEAQRCLERALGLTTHPRLQRFLRARLARLR